MLAAQSDRSGAAVLSQDGLEVELRRVAWRWEPEFAEIVATLEHHGVAAEAAAALRQVWAALETSQ